MSSSGDLKKRAFFDPRFIRNESRRSYRMALLLFGSILLTLFFQHSVVSLGIVTERSMTPTLPEGNMYLVNRYIYHFARPQRGEIVVLKPSAIDSDQYVKRVIAVEGDSLSTRAGTVYLNGRPLKEPYASGPTYPDLGPIQMERGAYFVMGDNRLESWDSRHFGSVPRRKIEGKIKPEEWFPFR